ncbi:hypothetical protein LIER_33305 [Lithospermum erythrorhizon]|uniref:CASP-like protein n=1 Tax=Lithospermum erythrorhizon TaxID=34254 RepID=A0AAV3S0C6_LITER
MKRSALVAASMAAASATAVSASPSSCSKFHFTTQQENGCSKNKDKSMQEEPSSSSDKFAPRFDGLRFIETLVTAHR